MRKKFDKITVITAITTVGITTIAINGTARLMIEAFAINSQKGKTMSDYIKREDAMELFDMLLEHYHDTGVEVIKHTAAIAPKEFHISEEDDIADFNLEIDAWKKDFSNIQSADVAPVRHGRWEVVDAEEPRRYGCSECKRLSWHMENYCPNCGARMDI